MSDILVTSNINPSPTINYRWRNTSIGTWSNWLSTTVNPFNINTPYARGYSYEIQMYTFCSSVNQSTVSSSIVHDPLVCTINNVSNIVVGSCQVNNTFSLSFLVDYSNMRDFNNQITSVIKVVYDNNALSTYYFNPNTQTGTQTITITGLNSDGITHNVDVTCIPS